MPVQIVTRLDLPYAAEVIHERLIPRQLVHVPKQAIKADVQACHFRLCEIKALRGRELAGDVVRELRLGDLDRISGIAPGFVLRSKRAGDRTEQAHGKSQG